ncbi:MAG: hypothetical protein P4L56_30715 [Candidatus Sulfopaludibacter sp.]|nr:hypothetical protein [Candidatus Sulfopaludibacter sp.]
MLLVEVKRSRQTSELWAAQFRRNLLAHGTLPGAPFFLIATPDSMYFWRQDDSVPEDDPPRFTLDAAGELRPYFERFNQTREKVSEQSLVLILFYWLVDLAGPRLTRAKEDPSLRWLSESGLLDALASSHIEMSAAQ